MQSPLDRALMQATQTGLPLTPTPYADLANTLGVSEAEVMVRLSTMHADGRLRRAGRMQARIADERTGAPREGGQRHRKRASRGRHGQRRFGRGRKGGPAGDPVPRRR